MRSALSEWISPIDRVHGRALRPVWCWRRNDVYVRSGPDARPRSRRAYSSSARSRPHALVRGRGVHCWPLMQSVSGSAAADVEKAAGRRHSRSCPADRDPQAEPWARTRQREQEQSLRCTRRVHHRTPTIAAMTREHWRHRHRHRLSIRAAYRGGRLLRSASSIVSRIVSTDARSPQSTQRKLTGRGCGVARFEALDLPLGFLVGDAIRLSNRSPASRAGVILPRNQALGSSIRP